MSRDLIDSALEDIRSALLQIDSLVDDLEEGDHSDCHQRSDCVDASQWEDAVRLIVRLAKGDRDAIEFLRKHAPQEVWP